MNRFNDSGSQMSGMPQWATVPRYLSKRVNPNFTMVEYDDTQMFEDFETLLNKRSMYSIANNYRSKLDEFVTRSGAKGPGMSNVNIVGLYQTGDVPGRQDIEAQARRASAHENYAEAIARGMTDVFREMGFTPNSKSEYPDYDTAKLAIEMESLSSKGPYDRGTNRTAFTVEENNLKDAATDFVMADDQLVAFARGLEKRRVLYASSPGVNKSKKFQPERFAEVMHRRGIGGTYRGGFNASGDSTITLSQIVFSSWIFERLRGLTMHDVRSPELMTKHYTKVETIKLPTSEMVHASRVMRAVREWLMAKYINGSPKMRDGIPEFSVLNRDTAETDGFIRVERLMTVDEFISVSADEIFNKKRYSVEQVLDMTGARMNVMGNLQRDQGSPFKYEWQLDKVAICGRKDRKYRMVLPVMAWVQMLIIAADDELLDVATTLDGRIGLQHPDVSEARMHGYLRDSFAEGCFNDSFDLTRFDAGIIDQMMTLCGLMYASLYDDENIKCILSHIGWWSMDKYMILAKPTRDADPVWDKYKHTPLRRIKGNRSKSLSRAALRSNDPLLQREAEAMMLRGSENDYEAVLLHVRRSWEPSGIFTTNQSESDINCAINTDLVWEELLKLPRVSEDPNVSRVVRDMIDHNRTHCQTSGDDIIIRIPLELLDFMSLDEIRELFAVAYANFNWTLNASKMSKVKYLITYKGKEYYIPFAEFLQWLYPQNPDTGSDSPRRKFCRAWPSIGYTERNSSLPLPMQYSSIHGRLNTALTTNQRDLEFAARMIVRTGHHLKLINRKKRYQVVRSKGVKSYISDGNVFFYNPDCEAGRSELCGMDDFFAYVKQYGAEVIGELSKWFAEFKPEKMVDYVDAFAQELETRAPHKTWLVKSLMTAFSPEEFKSLFGDLDVNSLPTVEPVTGDLVAAIEKLGVTITPKKFPDVGDGTISDGDVITTAGLTSVDGEADMEIEDDGEVE